MLFQFKIQVKGVIQPPVWRQLIVPAWLTFDQFHQLIQIAVGWKNERTYFFLPKEKDTAPQIKLVQNPDFNQLDATIIKLDDMFSENQKLFIYNYDLVDNWEHVIHLEKIIANKSSKIELLAGKGACPVEGCDGIWGYERVKKFLRNPDSSEWHEVMFEMFGHLIKEKFNPEGFDIESFNLKLKEFELSL